MPPKPANPTTYFDWFPNLTVAEIKERLRERGLKVSDTRPELVERLQLAQMHTPNVVPIPPAPPKKSAKTANKVATAGPAAGPAPEQPTTTGPTTPTSSKKGPDPESASKWHEVFRAAGSVPDLSLLGCHIRKLVSEHPTWTPKKLDSTVEDLSLVIETLNKHLEVCGVQEPDLALGSRYQELWSAVLDDYEMVQPKKALLLVGLKASKSWKARVAIFLLERGAPATAETIVSNVEFDRDETDDDEPNNTNTRSNNTNPDTYGTAPLSTPQFRRSAKLLAAFANQEEDSPFTRDKPTGLIWMPDYLADDEWVSKEMLSSAKLAVTIDRQLILRGLPSLGAAGLVTPAAADPDFPTLLQNIKPSLFPSLPSAFKSDAFLTSCVEFISRAWKPSVIFRKAHSKSTVAELKKLCESNNLRTQATKKDEFLDALCKHADDQDKTELQERINELLNSDAATDQFALISALDEIETACQERKVAQLAARVAEIVGREIANLVWEPLAMDRVIRGALKEAEVDERWRIFDKMTEYARKPFKFLLSKQGLVFPGLHEIRESLMNFTSNATPRVAATQKASELAAKHQTWTADMTKFAEELNDRHNKAYESIAQLGLKMPDAVSLQGFLERTGQLGKWESNAAGMGGGHQTVLEPITGHPVQATVQVRPAAILPTNYWHLLLNYILFAESQPGRQAPIHNRDVFRMFPTPRIQRFVERLKLLLEQRSNLSSVDPQSVVWQFLTGPEVDESRTEDPFLALPMETRYLIIEFLDRPSAENVAVASPAAMMMPWVLRENARGGHSLSPTLARWLELVRRQNGRFDYGDYYRAYRVQLYDDLRAEGNNGRWMELFRTEILPNL